MPGDPILERQRGKKAPAPTSHLDGRSRCTWPGYDAVYVGYHDTEWGVPEFDDRALFEKLILDGFQAGLSWITILRKRPAFRTAFDGFDPALIAAYDETKVAALLQDAGIVRNRPKIEATIRGAKAWLAIRDTGGFARFLWDFCDGRPQQNQIREPSLMPTVNDTAMRMSQALKAKGFGFCGPTIVYAFMQAVGMVNDHLVDCFRHAECRSLGQARDFEPK